MHGSEAWAQHGFERSGIFVAAAFAACFGCAGIAKPDPLAGFRGNGEVRRCIPSYQITATRVLDDERILFELSGRRTYVNRMSRRCRGLRLARGFAYGVSGVSGVCRSDVIHLLDAVPGACLLGAFEGLDRVGRR